MYLQEAMIASNWKGMLVLRGLARKIDQIKSATRSSVNRLLSELAPRWKTVLTKEDRDRWELYASLLGSAINREKEDAARGSHNIIRTRNKLMSGFNAYLGCNWLAMSAGLPYPKDIAPLGDPTPAPPSSVGLTYTAGVATVTWTDPLLPTVPTIAEKKIRIYAQIQAGKKVHTQIVGTVEIPSAGSFDFNLMRAQGAFDSPFISIGDMTSGLLRVQLDTVIAVTTVRGAVGSPPSEVAEAVITV
jgi:hypothetical protein